MIDSHAHIYLDAFDNDREQVLNNARKAGLIKIFMPNIDHTSVDNMLETEEKNNGFCYSMMGLHPCSVNKHFEKELYLVEEWLNKRPFIAVGEIGTDLYWDKTFWEEQKEAFKIQIQWAIEKELPIVIHCRDSIDETIELVEELNSDKLKGVFHCFTGNSKQAKRITELGDFYLGIGGVSTFKNGGLDMVLPDIDIKHLLLETDSPYLAPAPHRGKRNEPAFTDLIAKKIAELKGIDLENVKEATTSNALKLFKL